MIWKFLVWLDKKINRDIFKGRWETVSGRCYRRSAAHNCSGCRWLCRQLEKIQANHCRDAYFDDRKTNPELPWI